MFETEHIPRIWHCRTLFVGELWQENSFQIDFWLHTHVTNEEKGCYGFLRPSRGDALTSKIEDDVVADLAKLGISVNTRLLAKADYNAAMQKAGQSARALQCSCDGRLSCMM